LHRTKAIATVLIVIVALCFGCAEEEEGEVLAKIGSDNVTLADLEARLEGMPPFMREQLSNEDGRERLLKAIVEEEIIYREAIAIGLNKTDRFTSEIEKRKRDVLVRLFYEDVIEAASGPSDSAVAAYYETNPEEFTVPASARARHILVETEREALSIRKELEGGADFGEMAMAHSLDALTKERDGVIHGEIRRGAPIKGLGDLPELVEVCLQLEENQLSQPVKTEKGYHIVLLQEKSPERIKSFDEVRSDIVTRLSYDNRTGVRDSILGDLKSKYRVEFVAQSTEDGLTPEDLFKKASEEANPEKKVGYYRQFAERFPDNERVYEARFMIGFTLAEDVQDYDQAEEVFREFLKEYPESDLSDDAEWMLENMRSGEQPEFGSD
jgi:peptidyl-prolyl cis-trans isomerase C